MTSNEYIAMLDAVIARLPQLRENGVMAFGVSPEGIMSMQLAPRLPEAAQVERTEKPDGPPPRNPIDYGLRPGSTMPKTLKERGFGNMPPEVK